MKDNTTKIPTGIFSSILHIWLEELKCAFKDQGVLMFFVLVPIAYPLLYSWIYTNEVVRDIPIAIVDQSHSSLSRKFIHHLDASPDVETKYFCASLNEAKQLVMQQQAKGIIIIPSDLETAVNRSQQAQITVYCDMSLFIAYKAIVQSATMVSMGIGAEIRGEKIPSITAKDADVNAHPMHIIDKPIYNTTGGYGNAILPGVLILIIQQTLLLGIGMAAGTARERNLNHQLVPFSKKHNGIMRIIVGKALCYFMIYALVSAYITMVVPRIFDFTTFASTYDLFWFMVPFILSVIFFGMTLSGVVRHRENVMLLVVFTSVPFLFLTGISWPQSSIPGFWQGFSWLIPSTFGVKGFLSISSMGATLQDVKSEYIYLWIQALVYLITTYVVYRFQFINAQKIAIEQLQTEKESKETTAEKEAENQT